MATVGRKKLNPAVSFHKKSSSGLTSSMESVSMVSDGCRSKWGSSSTYIPGFWACTWSVPPNFAVTSLWVPRFVGGYICLSAWDTSWGWRAAESMAESQNDWSTASAGWAAVLTVLIALVVDPEGGISSAAVFSRGSWLRSAAQGRSAS
jgi:hypothetical protein